METTTPTNEEIARGIERGAGYAVEPDVLIALAATVNRDWGSYGYRMRVAGTGSGAYALVQHFDGSRFLLHSDRWCNVRTLGDV